MFARRKTSMNNAARVIAVIITAIHLIVLLFASNYTLHCLLHKDALKTDHSCAATLLSKGQILNTDNPETPEPDLPIVENTDASISVFSVFLYNLPDVRAPPVV